MTSAWKNRGIGVVLALIIFVIDQAIKGYVEGPLDLRNVRVIEILPFFDLRWVPNFGVSLGMLTAGSVEMRWILVAGTALIALFVLIWMLREKALSDILALAMVLGGAVGNIRDRFNNGYVIDYADLHFGEWRPFLVFNLADAAITIGVLIILARSLLSREKPETTAADIAPES